MEQDAAIVALAVKVQIGAKALKKKRATIPEDFRTKNVMVVTTRSNMKITKAGGRRETVIAEEVENGEEDGLPQAVKVETRVFLLLNYDMVDELSHKRCTRHRVKEMCDLG